MRKAENYLWPFNSHFSAALREINEIKTATNFDPSQNNLVDKTELSINVMNYAKFFLTNNQIHFF